MGCQVTPTTPPRSELVKMNLAHVADVGSLTRWSLIGKFGVRQPDSGTSFGIVWDQDGSDYEIRVRGPMGQSAALLRGNEHRVTIERAGEPTLTGNDVQALLREALGWEVPVNTLRFWIRGLPDPALEVESASYLDTGWFAELVQLEWHVKFSRYRAIEAFSLPGRVRASRDGVTLTLVVTRWNVPE
ncbi:MAG: lipoprotein insertase outer membrane protein LolB [Gammaproteobacteria bacterium]|nr:lipoprotein insertase outer membrane protein LolB [Gammaproteobacteria bacterium]